MLSVVRERRSSFLLNLKTLLSDGMYVTDLTMISVQSPEVPRVPGVLGFA